MIRIRNARESDIQKLKAVEESAAEAFIGSAVGYIPGGTVDPVLLLRLTIAKTLWVSAEQPDDVPVGFVACYPIDGFLYVHEISVAKSQQGKGIGRRLMNIVEDYAREQSFPYIGLVTFRNIKWNGPFYKSLGYKEIAPDAFSGLYKKYQASIREGCDPALRCTMIKVVED